MVEGIRKDHHHHHNNNDDAHSMKSDGAAEFSPFQARHVQLLPLHQGLHLVMMMMMMIMMMMLVMIMMMMRFCFFT